MGVSSVWHPSKAGGFICAGVRCVGTSAVVKVLRPSMHQMHAAATGHAIIASFEPDEDWFFDYDRGETIEGVELVPPRSHPKGQRAPGPVGRVPANWESLLNQ